MKKTTLSAHKKRAALTYFCFAVPGIVYLVINNLIPMIIGVIIAFKDVNFRLGILCSDWSGWSNFQYLFQASDAWAITRNTILYNLAFIILGTGAALLIALLLNEIKNKFFSVFTKALCCFRI